MKITKEYLRTIIKEELDRLDEIDINVYNQQINKTKFNVNDPKLAQNLGDKLSKVKDMKNKNVPDDEIIADLTKNLSSEEREKLLNNKDPSDKQATDIIRKVSIRKV